MTAAMAGLNTTGARLQATVSVCATAAPRACHTGGHAKSNPKNA